MRMHSLAIRLCAFNEKWKFQTKIKKIKKQVNMKFIINYQERNI